MAQRNPMNERYQGDGPQGKTRKSAAKLKPKTEAASSVHIERKPQTKQERKAAKKKRDAQLAAKEKERQRKAQEREKQARIAAGEVIEEEKKPTALDKVKGIFVPAKSESSQAQPQAQSTTQAQSKEKAQAQQPAQPRGKGPDTPEYKKLKRIYWVLMAVGVVAIIISFIINFSFPNMLDGWAMMVPMGIAYVAVIGAIILDYSKIRKMQREYLGDGGGGKQSPKQLKHAQQKAEAAALLEESKRAQKEMKRANSKNPFVRKPKSVLPDDSSDVKSAKTRSETSSEEVREKSEKTQASDTSAEAKDSE